MVYAALDVTVMVVGQLAYQTAPMAPKVMAVGLMANRAARITHLEATMIVNDPMTAMVMAVGIMMADRAIPQTSTVIAVGPMAWRAARMTHLRAIVMVNSPTI